MPNKGQSDIFLTLFSFDNIMNWQERVAAIANDIGMKVNRRGNDLIAWNRADIHRNASMAWVDGWRISRIWLGVRKHGLGITPHRSYFVGQTEGPSKVPEWKLTNGHPPPSSSPSKMIASCIRIGEKLAESLAGLTSTPYVLRDAEPGMHSKTCVLAGNSQVQPAGNSIARLLQQAGFASVPSGFRIVIICDNGCERVDTYAESLRSAMLRCHMAPNVKTAPFDVIKDALVTGKETNKKPTAFLIPVSGGVGDALPESALESMDLLEKHKLQYRLFSTDNPSMQWAAFDQLGSLLDSSGGVSYKIRLPLDKTQKSIRFVGIDLGHPKLQRNSWVVCSIVDWSGRHVRSWRCRQPRDETVQQNVLIEALSWARERLCENGNRDARTLVIRDGRLHRAERVETYRRELGEDLTFVEVAKYGNPLMFNYDDNVRVAASGSIGLAEDPSIAFINPVPSALKGQIPRILKIHMPHEWDGLQLGMRQVCTLLTGLCYAPGLGLRPHSLPAPIYWSDGIASIGSANHRFAGQKYDECISEQ